MMTFFFFLQIELFFVPLLIDCPRKSLVVMLQSLSAVTGHNKNRCCDSLHNVSYCLPHSWKPFILDYKNIVNGRFCF